MRATFVNELPWQLDDERAAILPIFYERFRGRTHHDATAVKEEDGSWTLCAWENSDTAPTVFALFCTNTNDPWPPTPPPTPPATIPICPGVEYPGTITVRWNAVGSGSCPCLTGEDKVMVWNPALPEYGGWEAEWPGCGGTPTTRMTITAHNPGFRGAVKWVKSIIDGYGTRTTDSYQFCGNLPQFDGQATVFFVCPSSPLEFERVAP